MNKSRYPCKLSIITINYNNKEGLHNTIESVIHQSFTDIEYIIIDGGSTDGSIEVIKQYNNNINYWISEPDKGIYNAMNKGILQANGEYLNFMNSGDCFCSSQAIEQIFSHKYTADIITGKHLENGIRNIGKEGITMLTLYKWALDHQASFIHHRLFDKRKYDEKYQIASDWKFFIETLIFDNCSFQFCNIDIVKVDMTGISNTEFELDKKERNEILHELFPERILADYKYLAKADSPLLKYTPQLNQTIGIQKFILWLVGIILKIKKIMS